MKASTFIKGITKSLNNPKADRFCPTCKGKGSYGVVISGEHTEEWQIIQCWCVNQKAEAKK